MTSPKRRARRSAGLTLTELLVSVALIAILAAILLPLFGSVRARMQQATCISNLKQISIASMAYSNDNRGEWPPNQTGEVFFTTYIIPYLGLLPDKRTSGFKNSPLVCPADRYGGEDGTYITDRVYTLSYQDPATKQKISYGLSYAQNVHVTREKNPASRYFAGTVRAAISLPAEMMLYIEYEGHYVGGYPIFRDKEEVQYEWLKNRHGGRLNAAFADGSVRSVSMDDIPVDYTKFPVPFWQGRKKDN